MFVGTIIFYFGDNFITPSMPDREGEALVGDVIIDMKAVGGSGESGRVALTFMGAKTKISLRLDGAPYGTLQPAHIHKGTCENIGEEAKYKLTFPATGSSESVIEAGLEELRAAGAMVIDIHKSFAEDKKVVSCGELRFN